VADYAHYVKRKLVVVNYGNRNAEWFQKHQPDDQGFGAPTYHITKSKSKCKSKSKSKSTKAAARVKVGDTIWIFSQLRTPWDTPPATKGTRSAVALPAALDAKIVVAKIRHLCSPRYHQSPTFKYYAGKGSRWFPLFDCSKVISRLRTIDSKRVTKIDTNRRPLPHLCKKNQQIGNALQSMRQLADGRPLLDLEAQFSKRGFDFVSYRLKDGTRSALMQVRRLIREGRPVFWDRWSLPRGMAERRETQSPKVLNPHILKALNRHIRRSIQNSCTVWGIQSDLYAQRGSYSRREKQQAKRLAKLKLI